MCHYLMMINFKHILIGLGPEVYLDATSDTTICVIFDAADIIVMFSFDTPESINFRFDKANVAENPNCREKLK